ncbi:MULTISPECIES: hypothetical protein [Cellulomonas]|jgi:hypothetical protein|uniref:hypothetical protein n=1 Tax=Cellulomonas TaxID=1707 RepID=UPI001B9F100C|nr:MULTISPECIES: hypothetical protein [Cellulomonas]VTR75854.1 hypothetical protein CHMI_00607 [Cellulomonas hominis]
MTRRRLPRIAALSGAEAARARFVVVHSPVAAGPGAVTWTLTLLGVHGAPLAESRTTAPDFPLPLADIAQVHLDVVGLAQSGEWKAVPTAHGEPQFQAPVRALPPPD